MNIGKSKMSHQGATLQTYNQELVKSLEELKAKRDLLQHQIDDDERTKVQLQKEVEKLSTKLADINEGLHKKVSARTDYDRTIAESEAAYSKIIESSQVLLNMVKRETQCLVEAASKKIKSDGPPSFVG